jgi:integrase
VDTRFLDAGEVEALLRAVPPNDYGRVYRVLYLEAVMTGARQGELLALRWKDIDWSAQRVRIHRNIVRGEYGTPKSGRGRSVPLADRLGGELDRLYRSSAFQADHDLVFCNPHTGRPLHPHAVLKAHQRHLGAAGVRQARFHDLRHTFGTRMPAGVPMRTLQEWMGHRDHKTTLIYADYAPSAGEAELINSAFSPAGDHRGTKPGTKRAVTDGPAT